MAKTESTGSRVANSAAKVLSNKKASKTSKFIAASALTQTKSGQKVSAKVASGAARVLKDPKASADAKAVAASALTQFPAGKSELADRIRRAVEETYKKK